MFEKIIFNLLSNAFKFTLHGKIIVSLKKINEIVELRIIDTGVGIPVDELPHMFERFHRVEQTQGRSYEGTGIGLALTYELVKLHGGSIRIESTLGKGSVFILQFPFGFAHLPVANLGKREAHKVGLVGAAFVEEISNWMSSPLVVEENSKAPHDASLSSSSTSATHRSIILIVDDNKDMCQYLKGLLVNSWNVLVAHDGKQALQMIQEQLPDLILSDVMMPIMNGNELLMEVRKTSATKLIPFILLSAQAGEEARLEGLRMGADDYLVKPFSANELLTRVNAHLALGNTRRKLENQVKEKAAQLLKTHEELSVETQERLRIEKELGVQFARRAIEAEERQQELSKLLQIIRATTDRLNLALQAGNIGTWSWEIKTNTFTCDEYLLSLYGVNQNQFTATFDNFIALVHFDDQTRVRQIIENTLKEGAHFEIDFRVIRPLDGIVHILAGRGEVYRNTEGHPERVVGVNWNITQQKRSEDERLLTAVLKASQVVPSQMLFDQLAMRGKGWETAKQEFVTDSGNGIALKHMKGLVEYRDILDYLIYRRAIEAIFPKEYYEVTARLEESVDTSADGNYQFKSTGYTFIVTNRNSPSSQCIIKINAPGSRLLTSDIDTSIYVAGVTGVNNFDLKFAAPAIRDRGPDFDGRVRNQIIAHFYQLSEELHHMTSTESRDSKAYADTITNDDYPHFNTVETNPSINDLPFIQDPNFYVKHKLSKHHLEQASSMVTVLRTLTTEEWMAFKTKLLAQLKDFFKYIDQNPANQLATAEVDLKQIFILAEKLHREAEEIVSDKVTQIKKEKAEYWASSPFSNVPSRLANDLKISAMNALYVEHLEKVTDVNGEIILLTQNIRSIVEELNSLYKEKNTVAMTQQTLNSLSQKIEILEKQLNAYLIQKADKMIERQASQIRANLFAHDAYVSHSAICHVVKGMLINKGKAALKKQTLMGSALQQIGSRLYHENQLRDANKSEAEIAYCGAKYGARLFDLFFNDGQVSIRNEPYTNEEIEELVQGKQENNSLYILSRLKSEALQSQMHLLFDRKKYHLINSEMKIVAVKNNTDFSTKEKLEKTHELLKERMCLINPEKYTNKDKITDAEIREFAITTQKNLFISIAVKLIAVGYVAKFAQHKSWVWGFQVNTLNQASHADKQKLFKKPMELPAMHTSLPGVLRDPDNHEDDDNWRYEKR